MKLTQSSVELLKRIILAEHYLEQMDTRHHHSGCPAEDSSVEKCKCNTERNERQLSKAKDFLNTENLASELDLDD